MIEIKVNMLEEKTFGPYGDILGPQTGKPDIAEDIIDFWPGVSDTDTSGNNFQFHWLEIKTVREFKCEEVERHTLTTEALIPIVGQSIVIVALSEDMDDESSPVDPSTAKAFYFDGTKAVNLKKGVWHGLPFPLTDKACYVVGFGEDTHKDNLEIVQLPEPIKVNL
jgi:ureidoglycolate hydrolase